MAFQDEVAVINFKSKANTIGQAVLDGIRRGYRKGRK